MAIYHLNVKAVSRSKGQSVVASAAYRSAEKLTDERIETTFDYTKKNGVDHATIIGFNGSRSELWNLAEKAEKRKDATVAKEYEIALPIELDNDRKIKLAESFGRYLHSNYNVAVDVCIHNIDSDNPHAHILTTTRNVHYNRLGDKIAKEWSDAKRKKSGMRPRKDDLLDDRNVWEILANNALHEANITERIDCRTLDAQGIEREAQVHVGVVANALERRGQNSERGELNREVMKRNRERSEMLVEQKNLLTLLAAEKEKISEQERIKKEFEDKLAALPDSEHQIDVYIYDQTNLAHEKNQKRYERAYSHVRSMINKVDASIKSHAKEYPQKPTGLFKIFKQEQHQREISAWESKSRSMRKREKQLVDRRIRLNELNEKNYQNEEKKLLKDHPEIELKRELVIKQQRKENIERMKKVQQRRALEKDQDNDLGY